MPRRGASSVVDSRSGIPEPRAVTGSLLRKVKVPPSIAEGPEGTPEPTPAVRSPVSWLVGLGIRAGRLRPVLGLEPRALQPLQPLRLAGRRLPPWPRLVPVPGARGRRPARELVPAGRLPADAPGRDAGRARPAPVPAPAGDRAAAVRRGLGAGDRPGGVAIGLGALGVGLAWWMLGGLRLRTTVRALTTGIFATGTVWWWASAVGSTWYLAHLVAADVALIAVGIALRRDPAAARRAPPGRGDAPEDEASPRTARRQARLWAALWRSVWPLDRSQVLVGFLLGLAVTARLPLIFAAPFFVLVGGGGTRRGAWPRPRWAGSCPWRCCSATRTSPPGSLLHPGYDYQYRLEAEGYSDARLQPRLVRGGSALRAAEPADHARRAAGGGTGRAARTRWASPRTSRCAPSPGRSARCSTSTAPW